MPDTPRRYFYASMAFLAALAVLWFTLPAPDRDPSVPSRHRDAPSHEAADASRSANAPQANKTPQPVKVPEAPDPPAPAPLSQHVVEYHIHVAWDEENRTLNGKQMMIWKHPGTVPVQELVLHLYPNAFASMNTTFNRESGGALRSDRSPQGNSGEMIIHSVTSADGEDLSARLQFVQPDDGNGHDRTLAVLRLYEPVYPGEEVTLHVSFSVRMPQVYARMGYHEDFVMAGQWFPKFAVYEPKGMRGRGSEGWNMHQYHGNTEFYADFGLYNVQIEVPADYTVAATGFPVKPAAVQGNTKTYRFYAEDVHDFAWAASPHFIYVEEPYSAEQVPGVKIKLYLDPRHEHLKTRYLQAAKKALSAFAKWYGEYPYSTLSIVVPPPGASGAGGMEYPTLITAWSADDPNPGLELERVVVHEIGHQFWYGMVANNEFEEAWLDEGFTSYIEDKLMRAEYGVTPNRLLESSFITNPAPLKQAGWLYDSHDHYAENVYLRSKLVLLDIERKIGETAMARVMRTYFQNWKFRHPTTADFQNTLESVTRQDWDEYFRRYVYGGSMADVAIAGIAVQPVTADGQTAYESRIVVEARAGIPEPTVIRVKLADGSTSDLKWDGSGGKAELKVVSRSPVVWALADPDYELILENRHINNFYKSEIDEKHRIQWTILINRLIETLIGSVAW